MIQKGAFLISILLIIVLAAGAAAYFLYKSPDNNSNSGKTACTTEAKQCPDGSYVGRIGLNCEFAECPESSDSGISGTVLLGPICPVVKNPPDPGCADKKYAATLGATYINSVQIIKQFSSDANGNFSVSLPPGQYNIISPQPNSLPRCSSNGLIEVSAGEYATATVYCDTGIR